MKYKLYIFIILLTFSKYNFSQTSIGLRGGATISADFMRSLYYQELTQGTTFGFVFKHFEEPVMGVQIEVNYTERGWNEQYEQDKFRYGKISNIEIPFMTHAEIGKKNTRFIINAGPLISYTLFAEKNTIINDTLSTFTFSYDDDLSKRFDYGIVFGLGSVYNSSFGDFQIDIKYFTSLSSLTKKEDDAEYDMRTNQVFSISLAYFFTFKRTRFKINRQ